MKIKDDLQRHEKMMMNSEAGAFSGGKQMQNGHIVIPRHIKSSLCIGGLLVIIIASLVQAKDIDIYNVSAKNNSYILMDNSGSMAFGVYEHNIDYGAMFDYFFKLNDTAPNDSDYNNYIYDTINNSDFFFENHKEMRKIYLWKGRIGVTVTEVDGEKIAFTGDSGDPDYLWFYYDLVDTNTFINEDGNLEYDGSGTQRLTVDSDGNILFDGESLPLGQDLKLHEYQTLYDGSVIDNGFGGLMNAPGNYFSGYEGVTAGSLNVAENGDDDIYFFVTGNWVNMQAMYNLHYVDNPDPNTAKVGDAAWVHEYFPIETASWSPITKAMKYPDVNAGDPTYNDEGTLYDVNLEEVDTSRKIVHPGAKQIQVHFAAFDINVTGKQDDFLRVYNSNEDLVAEYNNSDSPAYDGETGWSAPVSGDTVDLRLESGKDGQGAGYEIDKIRVTYVPDSYLMQSRLDVAKDAMLYTVDEFRGKMNWGFGTFNYNGTTANGATIGPALNANDNDDTQREAIRQSVKNVKPMYGTPLGEALQDIFETGYYGHRNSLDKLNCRKNYVIVVTDGFPSGDDDWQRIDDHTFTDEDNDKWTADPYQYADPPENYYDDVAHYLYTHSWLDHSEVPDPANSYYNVTPHQIAFGAVHPLLQDAAAESGGEYITAYNKSQLVAAFYALALQMSEAVSFTAPVVSVDAANKIQNGDDLYLGLFLPKDGASWIGNIKKFKLGDKSKKVGDTDENQDPWMIYDGDGWPAINIEGEFIDNTAAFWDDDGDNNDSDNYGSADVTEDGVGSVMLDTLESDYASGNYWGRPIYTYIDGAMTKLRWDTVSAADLYVADDATKDKLINFVYGYSFDADPTSHTPLALRDWPMGSIIHSRPVVIDYYQSKDPINNPDDISVLKKRYIVIGANDGMLHVFDDTPENIEHGISAGGGDEVFAFIPPDLLPRLKRLPTESIVEMVDGSTTMYRKNKQPKYLIFGERRGGSSYWCLDISNSNALAWDVNWQYTNAEIEESWSDVRLATIPTRVNSDGTHEFTDVAIFTAGYDNEEDNYPEPFNDLDNNGTPYNGFTIDNKEWDKNDLTQDVNDNDQYDTFNPTMNEKGRGIFVVDIDDPTNEVSATVYSANGSPSTQTILPFSVTYGAADDEGNVQSRTDMKYSFPSSPSIAIGSYSYYYRRADDSLARERKSNVLLRIYAVDIYSNIFKVDYDFDTIIHKPADDSPIPDWQWRATDLSWNVAKVFAGNPSSISTSGFMGGGLDYSDQGRKTFYPPAISWGGSCSFFDNGNYHFDNWKFEGTDKIASLFIGTGDREHPNYTMQHNRFYSVYDDSTVTAKKFDASGAQTDSADVSTVPYSEDNLLNLTCNELGEGTTTDAATRQSLKSLLLDDATRKLADDSLALEDGADENDAKGWYIDLEAQGDCTNTGALDNFSTIDADNHEGEKILSKAVLFYGITYFTSYQPGLSDPCNPIGNGFTYAIDYCDASAGYDLKKDNPEDTVQDRYNKYTNIYGVPSGFSIIVRDGEAGAMAMMGDKVVGPKGPDDFTIKSPGFGLQMYYWREGNSMQR